MGAGVRRAAMPAASCRTVSLSLRRLRPGAPRLDRGRGSRLDVPADRADSQLDQVTA
ncbi:protein of unassigned function [Methylobacterium oryzae CBMB20]|uniref:Protein of unassigned function n=1 Tax=Methylobacterium oryzae CBMB20 TaxID=693986 RepID=A0A089Q0K1_9HYPH|nr:protein of unassigned function [Methylobacterium oryzae CBMB20]